MGKEHLSMVLRELELRNRDLAEDNEQMTAEEWQEWKVRLDYAENKDRQGHKIGVWVGVFITTVIFALVMYLK